MNNELSFQEKYQRMETFFFLKNGRPLIRKDALKRIFFLSLKRQVFLFRCCTFSKPEYEEFNRLNVFKINLSDLELKEFQLACNYYLKDNLILRESSESVFQTQCFIKIFYKKENIRWDLIDEDLISLCPNNIVFRNKIPYIKNYNVYPTYPDYRFTNAANLTERREEDSNPTTA